MTDVDTPVELLPIREVVRQTGINPVTLRAWERRYGLITPLRTEGGHRLYTQQDVATIQEAMRWTERGIAVSKVGNMLGRNTETTQVPAAAPTKSVSPALELVPSTDWLNWQRLIHKAIERFDEDRLEQLYGQIFFTYPLTTAFEEILLPVWRRQQAHLEYGQSSQWLFLDTFLRARLLQRLAQTRQPGQTPIVLTALAQPAHELELLMAGLLLGSDEGGVRVLPSAQPFDELSVVCDAVKPTALVVFTDQMPTQVQLRQLQKLVLSIDCPVALAGVGADLVGDELKETPIANLGSAGRFMRKRLERFLAGHLDT